MPPVIRQNPSKQGPTVIQKATHHFNTDNYDYYNYDSSSIQFNDFYNFGNILQHNSHVVFSENY